MSQPETSRGPLAALRHVLVTEERGVAILEFIIAFPLQLLFVLGIMQLSLIYVGHQILNHAAYSAARAALVADLRQAGEEEQAHEAAAMVMSAIAGEEGVTGGRTLEAPGWGGLTRSPAALEKTRITTLDKDGNALYVVVTHDYELVIPVVNRIFAFPWEEFFGQKNAGSNENVAPSQRYGTPHLVIKEGCHLYRPWKEGNGSATTWLPAVPGVDTSGLGGFGGLGDLFGGLF